jgi:hypothetical protein
MSILAFIAGVAIVLLSVGFFEVLVLGRFESAWGSASASVHLWGSLAIFSSLLAAIPYGIAAAAQNCFPSALRSMLAGVSIAVLSGLLGLGLSLAGVPLAPAFVAFFLLAALAPRVARGNSRGSTGAKS